MATTTAPAPILHPGADQPGEGAVQRGAVYQAAATYGLNADVLWGIYGAESTWGRGGHNWFGLVAVPRTGSFAGDANAAAKTLRHLLDTNGGDYEKALRAYSGHSYGVSHLADVLKGDPTKVAFPKTGGKYDHSVFGDTFNPTPGPVKAAGDAAAGAEHAVASVASVGDTLSGAWKTLTDPQTWIRIVEIIGGVILLSMGLKSLTGGAIDPLGTVRKVATKAAGAGAMIA